MEKYKTKFNKLNNYKKIAVVFIVIAFLATVFIVLFVLIPVLNLSSEVTTADKQLDNLVMLNNIASVVIIVSMISAFVFILLARQKTKPGIKQPKTKKSKGKLEPKKTSESVKKDVREKSKAKG
jgi:glucan phosphoethanolaminetransferase (alkaline phosphatase superfamily)